MQVVYVCAFASVHDTEPVLEVRRYAVRVLRNELRSSGLVADTLTGRTLSLAQNAGSYCKYAAAATFFYNGVDLALLFLSTEMWCFRLCQEIKFQSGTQGHKAARYGSICLVSVTLSAQRSSLYYECKSTDRHLVGLNVISVRTYMDIFNLGERMHLDFRLFQDLKIYLSFKTNQAAVG